MPVCVELLDAYDVGQLQFELREDLLDILILLKRRAEFLQAVGLIQLRSPHGMTDEAVDALLDLRPLLLTRFTIEKRAPLRGCNRMSKQMADQPRNVRECALIA